MEVQGRPGIEGWSNQSSSGAGGGQGRDWVDCTPHYESVTRAPQYNHSQSNHGREFYSFVLAETLDNAIHATFNNAGEKRICLYFLYDKNNALAAVAVRDNGMGMHPDKGLEAYGTMGLSQEQRKKDAMRTCDENTPHNKEVDGHDEESLYASQNGNIGEFGVGALSNFAIAERVVVMTCQRGRECAESERVAEMCISAREMGERDRNKEKAFNLPRSKRCLGHAEHVRDDHPMKAKIIRDNEERDFEQGNGFTFIYIDELKQVFRDYMTPKGGEASDYREMLEKQVLQEVERTYHLYLHGRRGEDDPPPDTDDDEEEGFDDDDDPLSPARPCRKEGGGSSLEPSRKRKAPGEPSTPAAKAKKPMAGGAGGANGAGGGQSKLKMMVYAYRQMECMYEESLADVKSVETRLHKAKSEQELDLIIKVMTNQGPTKLRCTFHYCPFIDRDTRPTDHIEEPVVSAWPGMVVSYYWRGRWIPHEDFLLKFKFLENLKLRSGKPLPMELLRRVRVTIHACRRMLPTSDKLRFREQPKNLVDDDRTRFFSDWEETSELRSLGVVNKKVAEFINEQHDLHDREIGVEGVIQGIADNRKRFSVMLFGKDSRGKEFKYEMGDRILIQKTERRVPFELFGTTVLYSEPVTKKLQPVNDDTSSKWTAQAEKIRKQVPSKMSAFEVGPSGEDPHRNWKTLEEAIPRPVTAGYLLPGILVFVSNRDGKPLRDLPPDDSGRRQRPKIKVVRDVTQTHSLAEVSPQNPEGKLAKEIKMTDMSGHATECRPTDRSFVFPSVDDFFFNAGKYRVDIWSNVDGSNEGAAWKSNAKLSYAIDVVPSSPAKVEVSDTQNVDAGRGVPKNFRLGVKAQQAFKACLRDDAVDDDDKKQRWYDESTSGNIVSEFPPNTSVAALDVQPRGLTLQFQGPRFERDRPAHGLFSMSVDQQEGTAFEQLQRFNPTPVEATCTLRFKVPDGQGRDTVFEWKGYRFQVSAGDPKNIVFVNPSHQLNALTCQNHSEMPELEVCVVDKYKNRVTAGGSSYASRIQIRETLSYLGGNPECAERHSEEYTVTVGHSGTAKLGGRRIQLTSPAVMETESHELKLEVTTELRDGGRPRTFQWPGKDSHGVTIDVEPSTALHSARALSKSEGELSLIDGVYQLTGTAGSRVRGVYFQMYDEADNLVESAGSVRGWQVKWSHLKSKSACELVTCLPDTQSLKFSKRAGEEQLLTVGFIGPRGSGEPFDVQLQLVSVAGDPHRWLLCDTEGNELPEKLDLSCGEAVRDRLRIQLRDQHDNPIDIQEYNQDPNQAIHPKLSVTPMAQDTRLHCEMRGDWKRIAYQADQGVLREDASLLATCGQYQVTLSTFNKTENVVVKQHSRSILVSAGAPTSMQVTMKGVPGVPAQTLFTFGGAAGQPQSQLPNLPSLSNISQLQIFLHDDFGNKVEGKPGAIKKASLKLSGGVLSLGVSSRGKGGTQAISNDFKGRPCTATFTNVRLQNPSLSTSTSSLVVSCGCPQVAQVNLPLTFEKMNKVVGVTIKADLDGMEVRVGQALNFAVYLMLQTEDAKGLFVPLVGKKQELKGVKVKCVHQESGAEQEELFSSVVQPLGGGNGDLHDKFLIHPGKKHRVFKHQGTHTIQVIFTETRESIASLLQDKQQVSNTLEFKVLGSGHPHKLEVRCHSNLDGEIQKRVSNSLSCPQDQRMIIKSTTSLKLQVRDEHGNECTDRKGLCVVARIVPENQAEESADVSLSAPFEFANDAKFQARIDEAKKRRDEDERDQEGLDRDITQLQSELKDLEDRLQVAQEVVKDACEGTDATQSLNLGELTTADECDQRIQAVEQGQHEAGRRRAKVPEDIRAQAVLAKRVHPDDVKGLLVDLIYVEDDQLARLIAWKSGAALATLIVTSREKARDIRMDQRFHGLEVLSKEEAPKVRGGVKQNQRLVLFTDGPKTDKTKEHSWRNQHAAANVVEFHDPEDEILRPTIVFALLGNYCLVPKSFPDMDSLVCNTRGKGFEVPDVISVHDSSQIKANGVVGGGNAPHNIQDYEFYPGKQDLSLGQIEVLTKLRDNLKELNHCQSAYDDNHQELGAKLAVLKEQRRAKVKDLMASSEALKQLKEQRTAVSGSASQECTLPELEYFGDDKEERAMGLSGGFAFDVDEHGRSEVAMLGLKSNVGNMEGSYLLVCKLHQTSIEGGRRTVGDALKRDSLQDEQEEDMVIID